MKENFDACLKVVLEYEGGISDHPQDPGGFTNKGVTQRVYDAYRRSGGLTPRSVAVITTEELNSIYRKQYWDQVSGDVLPVGVDLVVFDYAVNSGASRAARELQRAIGCNVDGVVGALTLQALAATDADGVIIVMSSSRLRFMRSLKGWSVFQKGWTARVTGVRTAALSMIGPMPFASVAPVPAPAPAPAKAIVADQKKLKTADGAGLTSAVIGGAGQTLMSTAQQVQPHIADNILGRAAMTVFVLLLGIGGSLVGFSYLKRIREAGGLGGFIGGVVSGQS